MILLDITEYLEESIKLDLQEQIIQRYNIAYHSACSAAWSKSS